MGKAVLAKAVLGKVLLGIITAALWFALAEASHAECTLGVAMHVPGASTAVGR